MKILGWDSLVELKPCWVIKYLKIYANENPSSSGEIEKYILYVEKTKHQIVGPVPDGLKRYFKQVAITRKGELEQIVRNSKQLSAEEEEENNFLREIDLNLL